MITSSYCTGATGQFQPGRISTGPLPSTPSQSLTQSCPLNFNRLSGRHGVQTPISTGVQNWLGIDRGAPPGHSQTICWSWRWPRGASPFFSAGKPRFPVILFHFHSIRDFSLVRSSGAISTGAQLRCDQGSVNFNRYFPVEIAPLPQYCTVKFGD